MLLLLSAALLLVRPALAAQSAVDLALDAELARATAQLVEPGYAPPYFVSLSAIDVDSFEQRCVMGAAAFSSEYRQRLLVPEVRVGGYELDNHPVASPSGFAGYGASYEDDEFSLRHSLWLMLDGAYKSATADFLRKQAVRVQRGKTEYDFDDLSREAPRRRERERPPEPGSSAALSALCRDASRVFRATPGLLEASAEVHRRSSWTRLRSSEGARVDLGRDLSILELDAVDISTDGMRQYASRRYMAPTPESLPGPDEVAAAAREMAADLEQLKLAKTTSPFSAPALVDPSVSAAIVLAFGLRLSGEEQRDPGGAQIFRGKIGKSVLPADFELYDDPSQGSFDGMPLVGGYDFDDQGVPPQRTALIEDGVLEGFLLSRYPVIGFPRSNGHGRASPGYRPIGSPANLFLRSNKPLSQNELLARLREECRKRAKPYGLWVKKLRVFSQQQGTAGHGSIRLMPELVYIVDAKTGALTLVRDLDLVGTPLDLMNNILKAGDDLRAQNIDWSVPVSVVVPSLLLADAELQRAETKPEKRPILPAPVEEGTSRRVPTFPEVPWVQVERWVVEGAPGALPPIALDGLWQLDSRPRGAAVVVDAKLRGKDFADLERAVKELDSRLRAWAKGARVEQSVLSPAMTGAAYRGLYGDGWPPRP